MKLLGKAMKITDIFFLHTLGMLFMCSDHWMSIAKMIRVVVQRMFKKPQNPENGFISLTRISAQKLGELKAIRNKGRKRKTRKKRNEGKKEK